MSQIHDEIKQKIKAWLIEEGFAVKEKVDATSHFNLELTKGKTVANVVAPMGSLSIVVGGGTAIHPQGISAYQELEQDKRKVLLDELAMYLISNPSVSEYSMGPSPFTDFRLVKCISKPLFADTLTKERLLAGIIDIHKVWLAVQTILSKHTGSVASGSADSSASFYG